MNSIKKDGFENGIPRCIYLKLVPFNTTKKYNQEKQDIIDFFNKNSIAVEFDDASCYLITKSKTIESLNFDACFIDITGSKKVRRNYLKQKDKVDEINNFLKILLEIAGEHPTKFFFFSKESFLFLKKELCIEDKIRKIDLPWNIYVGRHRFVNLAKNIYKESIVQRG